MGDLGLIDDDSGLRRALNRIPVAIQIGAFLVWAAVAAFVKWEGISNHNVPPWLWAVELPGLALFGAFGLIQLSRSFGAPDRKPFELSRFWCAYFVVTGSLLVLGPWSVVDDDPTTKPYIGGPMFVVGLILLGLFLRHLTKPIRQRTRNGDRPHPGRAATPGAAGVDSGWYRSPTTHEADNDPDGQS
ncbi:MAG: hypothetical protein ABR511_11925 [Acidimicrobiales bacterium]